MQRASDIALLLAAAFFALCWLLPGHYWPWLSFQQEFTASVAALLFGLALLLRSRTLVWPPMAWLALACAAIPLLQWQLGLVRFFSDALLSSLYVSGFGLCIAAGATAVKTGQEKMLACVLGGISVGAFFSVALALMQWQSLYLGHFFDSAPRGARTWANLGQPNHLASLLALAVCAVLLAYSRRLVSGALTVLLLGWFGWGLISTQSRTGYVFVLLLAVGCLLYRRKAKLPLRAVPIVAAALLFFAAVELWPLVNGALDMARPPGLAERTSTGGARWIHWQVIADAIAQRPWFGYGWTQTALAQHAAAANHPATAEVLGSAHNIVLDLLVWNGLPLGGAILLAIVWWFVRQLMRADTPERFFALAIVCALTLHAMLEFPLQYAYFLLPLALAVGALDGADTALEPSPAPASRWGFAAAWGVCAAMTGWVAAEYLQVESAARTLRFVTMGIGVDKVSHAPEPEVLLLDRPRNLHRFMLTPARVDPDPQYLEWVRFMAMRHATPSSMLRHALAAGRNGQAQEAQQVLVRVCKLFQPGVCEQTRKAWSAAQHNYPELAAVDFPRATP
jgi:hypothetical protein